MTRLLPFLAIMALLLALMSVASAQEGAIDTSSDPGGTDDPPVALQQDTIEKLGGNESIDSITESGIGFLAEERIDSIVHAAFYDGLATSFTPGGDGWYALSDIGFEVTRPSTTRGQSSGLIRVAIHEDNSGSPAAGALYVAYAEVPAGTSDLRLTATFPDNAALEAGDTYWAVFDELTGVGQYRLEMAAGSSPNKANQDPGYRQLRVVVHHALRRPAQKRECRRPGECPTPPSSVRVLPPA